MVFCQKLMNHWTGPQAAQIAGVTYDTLNYWVKHGLLSPSTPASSPRHWSYYSLSNIVTITAIKTLRAQGVSLQTLRKAGTELGLRIDISLEQGPRAA
jgi:DNA-binding transcriptional MerR regulator